MSTSLNRRKTPFLNERINKFLKRKIDPNTITNSEPQPYGITTASQSFGDIKTIYVGKEKIVYLGGKVIYDGLRAKLRIKI